MKFLKGLALSLLDFLLFLSLTAFTLVFTLNYTILDPDFAVSQVDRLDVASLITEQIQFPPEAQFTSEAIDDAIADLEPWMKEQINAGIYSSYDYFAGRSQSLSIVISMEPVKESLRDNLREVFLQSPPPQLAVLPPAQIEQVFNEFYLGLSEQIPPTLEFNESLLPPEVMAILEQVRLGFGYFQFAYQALIGFIVLVILGIILINRQVKSITRGIGTTFLIIGAFGLIEIFALTRFIWPQTAQLGVPLPLQTWITQLLNDFLAPLQMFSIGLLAGGIALLIVSFVYKSRQASV
ncbi:MAG: hypothetical protein ACETVS_01605 [Dehalococcoidales bacterium]